ncbi:hypothetical protein [Methylocystis echinoides]|uniref:hypothetical protein n=1 Tax=Methylocystis echinoides TaxID=29468 RepID=UPI00248F8631|nr:hypothetical protein [Methylocystis echinoides]
MAAFVEVLDQIEKRSCAHGTFTSLRFGLVAPDMPNAGAAPVGAAQALAAYRSVQVEPRAPTPPVQPEPDPLASLMAEAVHSPQRLLMLRRQLAWRLHPDRKPEQDSQPLAEVNAAIDAALARARRRAT